MSKHKADTPLTVICHPYLFALKEGKEITQDLMDYNLLLLQRICSEHIRSPKNESLRLFIKPRLK